MVFIDSKDKKTVNFLNVTFDLTSGTYKPFMKPNNKLLDVHQQSNQPPPQVLSWTIFKKVFDIHNMIAVIATVNLTSISLIKL